MVKLAGNKACRLDCVQLIWLPSVLASVLNSVLFANTTDCSLLADPYWLFSRWNVY